MNRHANGRRGLIGRVKTAGATICGKCCPYGNPLQSQRVPTAPWKPSAPTLSTDTTAELLTNHQPGSGSLLLDRGGLILRYRSENSIAEADAVIQSQYDPQEYEEPRLSAERARRDRSTIEVLGFIEADEADPIVRRKLESVIQELVYDIELWEF